MDYHRYLVLVADRDGEVEQKYPWNIAMQTDCEHCAQTEVEQLVQDGTPGIMIDTSSFITF